MKYGIVPKTSSDDLFPHTTGAILCPGHPFGSTRANVRTDTVLRLPSVSFYLCPMLCSTGYKVCSKKF